MNMPVKARNTRIRLFKVRKKHMNSTATNLIKVQKKKRILQMIEIKAL